jgi:hypothetical protein
VVFGADSTTTYGGHRHYNNAQKLFEIGEMGSTLGIVTWGLGGLIQVSHRQLVAELSDQLIGDPPHSVEDACLKWVALFKAQYERYLAPQLNAARALDANPNRTPQEAKTLAALIQTFTVGFCIGGRVRGNRSPEAFEMVFDPTSVNPPTPVPVMRFSPRFWGVPTLMERLLNGIDTNIKNAILQSPHWTGGEPELNRILAPGVLDPKAELPLRDAIDWIFYAIYVTIKALKFSSAPPLCGGPIELAAITADRPFRWVTHKELDHALSDHATRGRHNHASH